ncbi:MAG TPA: peptide-methionine (R)-S-oxide reductase MsrB [Acidimicrobiales bacterium]|nr:peptide-methionine (R)-S-oxide reductase MsrB [Acidimicrobiales bacterium]
MTDKIRSDDHKVEMSPAEWKQRLTPEQFEVLRMKGTELAGTGKYEHPVFEGTFTCAGCGQPLFKSDDQFDSRSGWPSFDRPIDPGAIVLERDTSYGMVRTEVTCARCGGHLGHVFDDGPKTTGERFCINSVSIDLDQSV